MMKPYLPGRPELKSTKLWGNLYRYLNPRRSKNASEPISDHYVIDGTYNLVIRNVSSNDGGYYTCRHINKELSAVVYVIDVMSNGAIRHGTRINLTCSATYAGPKHDDPNANYPQPKMRFSVGGSTDGITSTPLQFTPGGNDFSVHTLSMEAKMIADRSLHGKEVMCEVYTEDPEFRFSRNLTLDILYGPYQLEILPSGVDSFYAGDKIECSALANPSPDYSWKKVESPDIGITEVMGKDLTITSKMAGNNQWACVVSSLGTSVNRTFAFFVDSGDREINSTTPGNESSASVTSPPLLLLCVALTLAGLHLN